MKLDPVSLKLFVAVAEERGIGKATEREHIAAAAISKRISELEITLGTQLSALIVVGFLIIQGWGYTSQHLRIGGQYSPQRQGQYLTS